MVFKEKTTDNELYVYLNGNLIYKKWLDSGVSSACTGLGMYFAFKVEPLPPFRAKMLDHISGGCHTVAFSGLIRLGFRLWFWACCRQFGRRVPRCDLLRS